MNKKNYPQRRYTPKSNNQNNAYGQKGYLYSSLLGFLVFLISHVILSLLGSLIISKGSDPSTLIPFVATISMTASAMIGGIVTSKITKSHPLSSFAIFISTIALSVLLASIINIASREDMTFIKSLLLKTPVIFGALFGTYIGSLKKKQKSLYSKYK